VGIVCNSHHPRQKVIFSSTPRRKPRQQSQTAWARARRTQRLHVSYTAHDARRQADPPRGTNVAAPDETSSRDGTWP
jgi:hypothetical protein